MRTSRGSGCSTVAARSTSRRPTAAGRSRWRTSRSVAGPRRNTNVSLFGIRAHDAPTMGDKSPKSMRKKSDQKQSKTDEDNRKKQAAVTAKQVANKKK